MPKIPQQDGYEPPVKVTVIQPDPKTLERQQASWDKREPANPQEGITGNGRIGTTRQYERD